MYNAVKTVKPLADFRLLLVFDNGERRVFNMTPWLDKGAFRELADDHLFATVRVSFDTIEWANGSDLCPETLYEESVPLENVRTSALAVAEAPSKYTTKRPKNSRNRCLRVTSSTRKK